MVRINHSLTPEALSAPVTLCFADNDDPALTDLHLKFDTVADFIKCLEESRTGWWRVFLDRLGRLVVEKYVAGEHAGIYTVYREIPRPRPNPSYPGAAFS